MRTTSKDNPDIVTLIEVRLCLKLPSYRRRDLARCQRLNRCAICRPCGIRLRNNRANYLSLKAISSWWKDAWRDIAEIRRTRARLLMFLIAWRRSDPIPDQGRAIC